jgi:hypothetical protein
MEPPNASPSDTIAGCSFISHKRSPRCESDSEHCFGLVTRCPSVLPLPFRMKMHFGSARTRTLSMSRRPMFAAYCAAVHPLTGFGAWTHRGSCFRAAFTCCRGLGLRVGWVRGVDASGVLLQGSLFLV